LIKVAYSTINQTDYISYSVPGLSELFMPPVLGSDGCGKIVKVGEGVSKDYIGKKVAFAYGAWSAYTA